VIIPKRPEPHLPTPRYLRNGRNRGYWQKAILTNGKIEIIEGKITIRFQSDWNKISEEMYMGYIRPLKTIEISYPENFFSNPEIIDSMDTEKLEVSIGQRKEYLD
jgi:hypothetical protein